RDVVSDHAQGVYASAGSRWDIGTGGSAAIFLDGEATGHLRYAGLDQTKLGFNAQSRYKFGMGSEAPWLSGSVSVFRSWHPVSLRDQYGADLTVMLGKRWNERWTTTLGTTREIRHQVEDIRRSGVFDTHVYDGTGTAIFGEFTVTLSPQWILS